MRVALDANPLFGPRTGVGTYVFHLATALGRLPDAPEIILPTVSLRRSGRAPAIPGTTSRHARAPFAVVQALWDRGRFPPAEWVLGTADVFHATNFVAPPFRRTPIVTTIHDLSFELHPHLSDHRVDRYREWVPATIARSRHLIAHSSATADEIAAFYGIDRAGVSGIHLGVDPGWFTASPPDADWRQRLGVPDHYLLFVGTPSHRKNIHLVLAALRAARAEDDGVPPLVLAGPPPGTELAGTLHGVDDVHVTGYLYDPQLRDLVAGASALLFPSRYEGFGLPILEALATGTPVLASDLAVHREVAGGHACLVDVEDGGDDDRVERLAHALVSLVRRPPSALARARGRDWAATFTWERTAAATLAVYEAAAG